jgi:hypothetical protein
MTALHANLKRLQAAWPVLVSIFSAALWLNNSIKDVQTDLQLFNQRLSVVESALGKINGDYYKPRIGLQISAARGGLHD